MRGLRLPRLREQFMQFHRRAARNLPVRLYAGRLGERLQIQIIDVVRPVRAHPCFHGFAHQHGDDKYGQIFGLFICRAGHDAEVDVCGMVNHRQHGCGIPRAKCLEDAPLQLIGMVPHIILTLIEAVFDQPFADRVGRRFGRSLRRFSLLFSHGFFLLFPSRSRCDPGMSRRDPGMSPS